MAEPKSKKGSLVVVKKKKKKSHNVHHGGSWKIAYADFVTAMMAFFMLMWLINVTTDEQKKGIADYFSPNLVDMQAQNGSNGMLGGTNITNENNSEGKNVNEVNIQGKKSDETDTQSDNEDANENNSNVNVSAKDKNRVNAKDKDKDKDKNKDSNDMSEAQKHEQQQFVELTKEIKNIMKENPELKNLMANLVVEIRPEGLLFQIIDQDKRSMFASGSSLMQSHTKTLLRAVARVIKKSPNKITITGHTDATPYVDTRNYSNWELSVDRANATRRFLEESGVGSDRIESVIGKEATEPYVKNDPYSPQNRRISILLLRKNPIQS